MKHADTVTPPFMLRPLHPALGDDVVLLRPWIEADIPAMVTGCSDPDTQRWTLVPRDYTEAHAREHVHATARRRLAGESVELAIASATDPAVVLGSIGLMELDAQRRTGEIGYWILPSARRQGIASRAVLAITEFAFGTIGLARVYLRTMDGNHPSQAVAVRTGFTHEGIQRSASVPWRGEVDFHVYVRAAGVAERTGGHIQTDGPAA